VTPDRLRLSMRAVLRLLVRLACVPACVAALLLLAPAIALAGKPAAKHKPAAHAAAARRAQAPAPPAATAGAKERTPSAASTESTGGGGGSDDADDSSSDKPAPAAITGGKRVTSKTYTFGAMDVEGKLKTPQLLYFLNRVKLELDMSAPDKRSFMKELQQSADDKNL
jgi:hypothetical protein